MPEDKTAAAGSLFRLFYISLAMWALLTFIGITAFFGMLLPLFGVPVSWLLSRLVAVLDVVQSIRDSYTPVYPASTEPVEPAEATPVSP